jgi:GNAT superfamily N-acetyltransferase
MADSSAITYRPARPEDALRLAELFTEATEGVCLYSWSQRDPKRPPLETGAARLAGEDSDYSYRNAVVAETDGSVVAMMLAFPIGDPPSPGEEPQPRSADPEEAAELPAVLVPYTLELPGSYYLCGMAVAAAYRGQGIARHLLARAKAQARERGYGKLSLLVFEANRHARAIYERDGFALLARRPIVPHPLLAFDGGDILLMAREV